MFNQSRNKVFASLFKKFRLRSEIETLSDFGNLFADMGMTYETSLFTRWQNGERVPHDRRVVMKLIKLFIQRGGINSADEANLILESLDMRDLTNNDVDEIQEIFSHKFLYKNNNSEFSQQFFYKNSFLNSFIHIIENVSKQSGSLLIIYTFAFFTFYWLLQNEKVRFLGDFASTYFIMAVFGGLMGFFISHNLQKDKNLIGKAVMMFSFGLLSQVFGQLAYTYYILGDHIKIPYPSLGDIGYFGTIPFYTMGVIYLARALGVKIVFRSFSQALSAIVFPLIMLVITYIHLIMGYRFDSTKLLTILLDFGYPLGQSIYISISILVLALSERIFGDMKNKMRFIILALISQYMADYVFIYQANDGTWITGGINDYMYFVSYFFMALALIQFNTNLNKSYLYFDSDRTNF
ncbi:hypothetical protein BH09PAT2_BH09PAT2_08550 [soil metagenome]